MKNERGSLEIWGIVALVVLALVGYGIYAFSWYGTSETRACTVVDKQATAKQEGGTKYIVFTEDCGQLQVADDIFLGNYNSTDVYGGIKVGTSYYFKTVGWRNGFFSAYPNIDEVQQ